MSVFVPISTGGQTQDILLAKTTYEPSGNLALLAFVDDDLGLRHLADISSSLAFEKPQNEMCIFANDQDCHEIINAILSCGLARQTGKQVRSASHTYREIEIDARSLDLMDSLQTVLRTGRQEDLER